MTKKILLLSFISIFVAMATVIISFKWLQTQNKERYINEQYIENEQHLEYLINKMRNFYIARAYANMNSLNIKELIKTKNRAKLYKLILPRYKNLQTENKYLCIMHFHNSDGTTLLRMHNNELFGDNIAESRNMLRDVHESKEVKSGFEVGLSGVAFRVVVPVIDKGIYIGALEFGVDLPYILDELEELEHTNAIIVKDLNSIIESKFNKDDINNVQTLIQRAKREDGSLSLPVEIKDEKNVFVLNKIVLELYDKKERINIVYSNDITDLHTINKKMTYIMISVSVLLLMIVWGLQSYAFKRFLKKLAHKQRYLRLLIDAQPNMIVISDEGMAAKDVNHSFLEFTGFGNYEEFRKKHVCVCEFFEGSAQEGYLQKNQNQKRWIFYILEFKDKEHKVQMRSVLGTLHTFIVHAEKIINENGKEVYLIIFDDITSLEIETRIDPLTKLSNRRSFNTVMHYIFENAKRHEIVNSVIMFDIDHFKVVNDTYGHQQGDDVLVELSLLIKEFVRESDIAVRWGGEEFIVLLFNTDLETATDIANKLRVKIADNEVAGLKITTSFGVTTMRETDTIMSMIERADSALYKAKERGRNCVVSD